MASQKNYYVIDNLNCKIEGMTKEQILEAIEQAISTGEIKDIDTGFITKIKELNKGQALRFWVGTQAEFNNIAEPELNVLYIVTDDKSKDEIYSSLESLSKDVEFANEVCGEIKGVDYQNAITLSGNYNPTGGSQSQTFEFGNIVKMPDNTAYLVVNTEAASANVLNKFAVEFGQVNAFPAHPIFTAMTAIYTDNQAKTHTRPITMHISTGFYTSSGLRYNIEIPEMTDMLAQNDIQICGTVNYIIGKV